MPTLRTSLFALVLSALLGPAAAAPAATSAAAPATGPAAGSTFAAQATARFADWDRDRDGNLSADEIELAVHDPMVKGEAAAAAAALRRAIRMDAEHKAFPREILAAPAAGEPGNADAAAPKRPRFESLYAAALAKIKAADRRLFADGAPKLDSLGQGRLGDCFLLASLGAVTANDPDRLKRLFEPTPDGKIAVRFGDGRQLVLNAPTDAEIAIGASTRNTGTWANAYELAVGERLLERQKTRRHVTPLSIVGVGGTPHVPLQFLTGHKSARLGCEDFLENDLAPAEREAKLNDVRDKLVATQSAGRLIVGGTAPLSGPQVKVPGLYYNHSYAVLKYDRATDVVTFWNPMGNGFTPKGEPGLANGYKTSHGRFDCPLTEAVMWFGSFSVETGAPVETSKEN